MPACRISLTFVTVMTVSKTRTRLVDVARGLFAKQGLENTTMNDIAVASGKGRRTLYTYFKNKGGCRCCKTRSVDAKKRGA